MSERIGLRAGDLAVELMPSVGGSVARFDRGDQALFRPAPLGSTSVLDMGCFPLVPYSNRIRGGRFRCDGREITLAPNMPPDPSPLHGQGWLSAWQVECADERSAVLSFEHEAGEWPWAYRATQRFVLDEEGLSVELACENRSPDPMPCGLALHPYYPCDGTTTLDAGVTAVWTIDEHVLPVERVPAEGRYSLRERRVCGQELDHGFDGWDGRATIDWGERGRLVLSSPDAPRMQVFSPATGGFFVCEPVQNANCALNAAQEEWRALGIVMLAQAQVHRLEAKFALG